MRNPSFARLAASSRRAMCLVLVAAVSATCLAGCGGEPTGLREQVTIENIRVEDYWTHDPVTAAWRVYDPATEELLLRGETGFEGETGSLEIEPRSRYVLQVRNIKDGEAYGYIRTVTLMPDDHTIEDTLVRTVSYSGLNLIPATPEEFQRHACDKNNMDVAPLDRGVLHSSLRGDCTLVKSDFDSFFIITGGELQGFRVGELTKHQAELIATKMSDPHDLGKLRQVTAYNVAIGTMEEAPVESDGAGGIQSSADGWGLLYVGEQSSGHGTGAFFPPTDSIVSRPQVVLGGEVVEAGDIFLRRVLTHQVAHAEGMPGHSAALCPDETVMSAAAFSKFDRPRRADAMIGSIVNEDTYSAGENVMNILGLVWLAQS